MKSQQASRVFVIEAKGRALVAFEAITRREADELRKEQWFHEELLALCFEKHQIWDGRVLLTVRGAEPAEITEFKTAQAIARNKQDDGIFLAYLIPLDGTA